MCPRDDFRPVLHPRVTLDHIVVLVSHKTLLELPDRLKDSLVVIEGGEHAGGLTVNKLIIFPDGVYIELIAFQENISSEERLKHRWGSLEEGRVVDWACTVDSEKDFYVVQDRVRDVHSSIVYADPVSGGRTRPDGTVLEWSTASVETTSGSSIWPGYAPFWCLDRTPRHLRVPYLDLQDGQPLSHTQHPSGALGVARVDVSLPEKEVATFASVYGAVFLKPLESDVHQSGWRYNVPHENRPRGRVSLAGNDGGDAPVIKLTLLGNEQSPQTIELLPNVVLSLQTAEQPSTQAAPLGFGARFMKFFTTK